jgi:ribosomal protein S18 acetylase RimI-like enzyme
MIFKELGRVMGDFDFSPITRGNYMDIWEVYESNPEYFLAAKGRVAKPDDILDTFERLPDFYDASRQIFVGIWQNGRPVAVLEVLPGLDGDDILYFSEIIVHHDYKRRGIGKKIVKDTINFAKSRGFKEIRLGVGDENPEALHFWQDCGFAPARKYEDMTLLIKELK